MRAPVVLLAAATALASLAFGTPIPAPQQTPRGAAPAARGQPRPAVQTRPEIASTRVADDLENEARYTGLRWTFVRIRWHSFLADRGWGSGDYWSEPWAIDAPAADQNFSRRVRSITSINVGEPKVLTLTDPQLFEYPWIYFVEPGTLRLSEADVRNLREFLSRGGFAMFDDFHGPYEWENFEREIRRVFPDRAIVDLPMSHPIFHCFYDFDRLPQVPGLGSFLAGRTWEKGGFIPHLRAITDDQGRIMVLVSWNSDIGDGWEWSNAEDYPGYVRFTAEAYRLGINFVTYALTH